MVDAAPNTYEMDEHLKDLIQAVYSACSIVVSHQQDDPAAADKAVADCEELLGSVMEGKTEEWVA